MEKIIKIIFIITIIGFIGVILYVGNSIINTIIQSNNNEKEFNLAKKLIIGTWIYEKNDQNRSCTKTLKINNEHEFVFECVEEEKNQIQIKYIITGKCYVGDYKIMTYKFDRKTYENIVNAPEQKYNWIEYSYKEAPTANINNDKLELFGEKYIKKEL